LITDSDQRRRRGGYQNKQKESAIRDTSIRAVVAVVVMGEEAKVVGQKKGKGLVLDDGDQRRRIVDKTVKESRRRKAQNVSQQEILRPEEHEIVPRRRGDWHRR